MLPDQTSVLPSVQPSAEPTLAEMQQEALVKAAARWRALEQATGQITWVINVQGHALDSSSWCSYTGQAQEDAHHHWLDAIHPADQALVTVTWAHAFTCHEPYHIEYRIRRADGEYRMFNVRGVPVYDESGTLSEWVGACTDVTDRSQAQQELLAVQEQHRLLFATTSIGIIYQDAHTGIQSANPAAERILGYSHNQLLGQKSSEAHLPTIHENGAPFPGDLHPASKALRTGKPVSDVVMGILHPQDSTYHWLNVSAVPHFHPGEAQPYQVFVTFEDITERLLARRNMQDSLATLLEMARMLVTEDQPANQSLTSGILERLSQLLLAVMNCHTVGVIHLEPETMVMHPVVISNPDAERIELYFRFTDGIPLDTFLSKQQIERLFTGKRVVFHNRRDANPSRVFLLVPLCIANRLTGFLSIDYGTARHTFTPWEMNFIEAVAHLLTIVDERDQLRGEAAKHGSQFAGLFETISDGVAIYDNDGRFVAANQAMRDLYGYDVDPATLHESLVDRAAHFNLRDIQGRTLGSDVWGLAQILQGSVITSANAVELIATRLDGRDIHVSITGAPIRDAQGEITGAVTVSRDITERARLDQMKDDFINIASHELRAPLTPVILACRFIQRAINRPEQAAKLDRYAGEIVTHAKRLSRLVDDMLDMTRITNNHFAIQLAPCDLAQTIRDAIEEQRMVWRRTIFEEGLTQPVMTLADTERIWQVMTNLLTNAIKYAPPSEPIVVRAEVVPSALESILRITVLDRGPGIPVAAQSRIFERFYRLPDSDQALQAPNGLGLGLFITRAIVQAHGGKISVESAAGGGSAFMVELPLSTSAL